MRLLDTYSILKELGQPLLLTRDVAAYLETDVKHASKLLTRLQETGQLIRITSGKWVFPDLLDRLALPTYLTSPFPSYVSLQSALYFHGMVSQIPHIIYAVSPGRTKRYKTQLGTVSVHHIQPDFFFGYDRKKAGLNVATPEKALVDMLYFFQTKSRLFRSIPELEIPRKFNWKKAERAVGRIPSKRRRAMVRRKLESIQKQAN